MTTPARKAALLRLLEDWEAGKMTAAHCIPYTVATGLARAGLIAHNFYSPRIDVHGHMTLCPAGLAAARALRGEG
jgi:hypothetical protein